ncbi:MAG: peptidylprolyl isomerase [Candidatus Polarisedimenticolia bacterium]
MGKVAVVAAIAGSMALQGVMPLRAAEPQGRGKLEPTLEVLRPFTYEGEPLLVRIAIFNTGDAPFNNSSGIDLLGGLGVSSSRKGRLKIKDKPAFDPKQQPGVIPPGGFFGVIHDIAPMAPEVATADTYTLSWEAPGGWSASPVTVKVIPRFDPEASYVAVMETDYGNLEFDLKSKQAPRHVQNFHDLAMQGYYDNTQLHQVIRGVEVRGGDPSGTGNGWPVYLLEPEIIAGQKHTRGTLSMVRFAPGQDNGSQFVITLSPLTKYDGELSIFGQLRSGDETLTAIENIPTSGQQDAPYYKPVKPVLLKSVTVRKASTAGK